VAKSRAMAIALTAAAAALLAGCGAPVAQGAPAKAPATHAKAAPAPWRARRSSLIPGDILIADSYNNRIVLVSPQKKILWQFPAPGQTPNLPFARPDDAFFTPGYGGIITNEEDRGTIAIISFRDRRVIWEYGKAGQEGSGPGELNFPDDAFYNRTTDTVTVADIRNQRILFIDRKTKRIVKQYGKTGVYSANPPTTYAAPNGDFPAPGGGMLVTQIGGQDAILLDRSGNVVYTVPFPGITYPSDANFTPSGNIIVADYTNPGQVLIVSPRGKVIWRYDVQSGPGKLNQPSLAVQLPNGDVMLNDDYNDRVIVIDPRTDRIVWQYGHTAVPGSSPGYLNIPDGFDILPNGAVPGRAPVFPSR
jgi:outer membrane protein assembly factor BamB